MTPATRPIILLTEFRCPDISAEFPSLFARAGCEVHVYAPKGSWLLRNSYWDQWFDADSASPERFVSGLVAQLSKTAYAWVIPTEDGTLGAVEAFLPEEFAAKIFPVDPAHRGLLGSKLALSELSMRYGIRTPEYSVYEHGTDLRHLSYPIIAKVDRSNGGAGVRRCGSAEELEAFMGNLAPADRKSLVLQKFIPGTDISAEALFKEGSLIAAAVSEVRETMGSTFGVSTARTYAPDPEAARMIEQVGHAFGLNGFCSLTFRKEAGTEILYLIEADPRVNIWFALDRFAGLDFSEAIRMYQLNELGTLKQREDAVKVRHFHRDILRSLEGKDYLNLLYWAFNKDKRWRFIPGYDRILLRACMRMILITYLRRYRAFRAIKAWVRAVSGMVKSRHASATS